MPCAVGLVVSEEQTAANVMTVSCFSEAAHYPTTLWVCIAHSSHTHRLIERSRRFTLVVLHDGQAEIALRCGTLSGRDRDKTEGLGLHRGARGFLYPADALSAVACCVRSSLDVDDHTLYVADMIAGEMESKRRARRHLLTTDLGPGRN